MNRDRLFTGKQFLSLHLLESVAAALPVRDENGQAKQIVYGGTTRTLITSAARRRAERTHSRDRANKGQGPLRDYSMGTRTREWANLTADAMINQHGWDPAEALDVAKTLLMGVGLKFGDKPRTETLTKVLVFAPQDAGERIAALAEREQDKVMDWVVAHRSVRKAAAEAAAKKKAAKKAAKDTGESAAPSGEESLAFPVMPRELREGVLAALAPRDAIDIALFGRFLAEISDSPNVDGAVQTAHAFTVHAAEHLEDFFAAADDAKLDRRRNAMDYLDLMEDRASDDAGAGMTGYQSLISGTFYRHTVLDRWRLRSNLLASGMSPEDADKAAVAAERELVDAFVNAFPQAKKTSTASTGTLPKFVMAFEGDRPFNYAGAFERPVQEDSEPASHVATRRLIAQHRLVSGRREDVSGARFLTYDLGVQELLEEARSAGVLPGREVTSILGLTAAE